MTKYQARHYYGNLTDEELRQYYEHDLASPWGGSCHISKKTTFDEWLVLSAASDQFETANGL